VLDELRIDEATWERGTEARRHEWRLCLNELLEEGQLGWESPPPPPRRGLVRLGATQVHVDVLDSDGNVVLAQAIPLTELKPLIDEYMQICRDISKLGLGQGVHSPRLEALDIAKRITHDEAGQLIATRLATLRPDHATARRIFTLLVTLFYDTTKLTTAHVHRR
jgi:uncharacterized protein (UPF0262 family)